MSKKRIAINGFGRIGRMSFRILEERTDVEVVGINDLTDVKTLAHLLRYDSVHGKFSGEVEIVNGDLQVNGRVIKVSAEKNPLNLPWKELIVDSVIESTGVFVTKDKSRAHIEAGAKKVVISAPASGDLKSIVLGVNEDIIEDSDVIISSASCTTNCLAPMVKVLDDSFGIERGFITTVHSYTADQRLHDSPHSDLRRSRAAAVNMIPTSTGAAAAVSLVLPQLAGKLDGVAVRVPTPTGSITDLTAVLKQDVTIDQVNDAMRAAANGAMNGILCYSEDPLVSSDIVGDSHSCIFDSDLTRVSKNVVKIFGWYDNETGYANRVVDLVSRI
ncbi:MAG: type I glyceraldehyde-3-phosphate dehydrogenase [Flavobacteriales bacterium]|nr:type I glyceraldehyde-3-phosphate dehydrogenase [Flavobacteriales bacterium]